MCLDRMQGSQGHQHKAASIVGVVAKELQAVSSFSGFSGLLCFTIDKDEGLTLGRTLQRAHPRSGRTPYLHVIV